MRYITEEDFYQWLARMYIEYRHSKVGDTFKNLLEGFREGDLPDGYGIEFRELEEE